MPKYTTGEIANLANVSVRTVQFYDTKDLLHPSEVSEGGRRLYSENDLKRLKLICALKSLGLGLDSIKGILSSKNPRRVLSILLDEQTKELEAQMQEKQEQMETVKMARELIAERDEANKPGALDVANLSGIKEIMDGRKQMKKIYTMVLAVGVPLDILEIATLALWIMKGIWWPFVASLLFVAICGAIVLRVYQRNAAYICPECGAKFKPSTKDFFFAKHTMKARVLTCTNCGTSDWCIEVYSGEVKNEETN